MPLNTVVHTHVHNGTPRIVVNGVTCWIDIPTSNDNTIYVHLDQPTLTRLLTECQEAVAYLETRDATTYPGPGK